MRSHFENKWWGGDIKISPPFAAHFSGSIDGTHAFGWERTGVSLIVGFLVSVESYLKSLVLPEVLVLRLEACAGVLFMWAKVKPKLIVKMLG